MKWEGARRWARTASPAFKVFLLACHYPYQENINGNINGHRLFYNLMRIDIKVRVPWGNCPWRLAVAFLTELILAGLYSRLGSSVYIGFARVAPRADKESAYSINIKWSYDDIPVLLNLILIFFWDLLLRKYPENRSPLSTAKPASPSKSLMSACSACKLPNS